MNNKIIFLALAATFSNHVFASQIDNPIGKTYAIKEQSFLDYIQQKLSEKQKNGEIKKMEEEFKKRAIHSLNNPVGVNIPRATENTIRHFDTTITLTRNVLMPDGQILYKAGTKFNPLLVKGLSKKLVFIDGRDPQQVQFALKDFEDSQHRDKIILVAGSFMDFMKKYKVRVYFDQTYSGGGFGQRETLVKKFGIRAVPSVVYQENFKTPYLTIREVNLDEQK
ncbi:hypothetical protein [Hydrogenovibrio marinus]|uniref:Conjugal transfer protein TraW n=1 Tax=Hydrogenovibrio marinus TaxID=28885 RepID=A0A066ZR49_HYDMR|nr:hypothetical protein [Hydrogenovibrio marinus]KDN94714.1 hypothetical protein EI16_12520 [Hydrogenovibrio marinus]